jgi:hypothetical protein
VSDPLKIFDIPESTLLGICGGDDDDGMDESIHRKVIFRSSCESAGGGGAKDFRNNCARGFQDLRHLLVLALVHRAWRRRIGWIFCLVGLVLPVLALV